MSGKEQLVQGLLAQRRQQQRTLFNDGIETHLGAPLGATQALLGSPVLRQEQVDRIQQLLHERSNGARRGESGARLAMYAYRVRTRFREQRLQEAMLTATHALGSVHVMLTHQSRQ